MSKLDAAARQALPQNAFAVPSKAPGPGSYPIPDASHAENALARSSGKPAAPQVRAAVAQKFPGVGAKVQNRPGTSLDDMATTMHPGLK